MASSAIPVHGATVSWGTVSGTYTAIPECKTLLVPEVSPDYIDVTSLDSTNGYRDYIVGLKDTSEITLRCNYIGTTYSTARGYADNNTLIYFETELTLASGQSTTGDVFEFAGYVVPSIPSQEAGNAVELDIKVRLSGDVTFTAGS